MDLFYQNKVGATVSVLHIINRIQNVVISTLIQRTNVNGRMCVHNCMSVALCLGNRSATVDFMLRRPRSDYVNSDTIILQRHAYDEATSLSSARNRLCD